MALNAGGQSTTIAPMRHWANLERREPVASPTDSRIKGGRWWLLAGLLSVHCVDETDRGACRLPAGDHPDAAVGACNGSPMLCSRRYDEVVHPCAHNAMSNADEGWYRPNQRHGIEHSLDDGVRGLMIDAHAYRGEVYLCHSLCALGRRPMLDALCGVKSFLSRNPGEVISLLIENHVPDSDLAEVFRAAGLTSYLHEQPLGAPWPTLGAMVDSGRRLVVFVETGGGTPAWLHSLFNHSTDTPYSYENATDFDCSIGRGRPGAALFTVNHFLTRSFGSEDLARSANTSDLLRGRIDQCSRIYHRLPTFIAVDYYDVGDLLSVSRELNGIR